ncbi:MAG: hypothetical protein ACR2KQ_03030 [Actinomycetota bacterium]
MKFVYMATSGTTDPTKASLPLHLAVNGSVEVGHDTEIVLAGDAVEIMIGDNRDTLEGVGVPTMRELFEKVRAHSVPVFV